jgi:hypothetical protein
MTAVKIIHWEEPNRRNTPPLHIAARGDRFSTLTGVWWLDEYRYVVNHRSGLRMALFDLRAGDVPLVIAPLPHLSDDIAAKRIGEEKWEIAVSGCWDCAFSLYHLSTGNPPEFRLIGIKPHSNATFCHGVAYDPAGRLWLAFHTGSDPRIEAGSAVWRLPAPWGARDICIDENSNQVYAIAVSKNPTLTAYDQTATSIWRYEPAANSWNMIHAMKNVHSDACRFYGGRMWLPDQVGDRVLGLDLHTGAAPKVIQGNYFDFPHGLDVSQTGILAVTNYGSSSLALFDLHAQSSAESAPQPHETSATR